MKLEKRYYVYVYQYPARYIDEEGNDLSGIVFYVGKGAGNRWREHLRLDSSKNINDSKKQAISRVHQLGLEVVVRKIAFFDNEVDAFLYEWGTIIAYQTHLTNMKFDFGVGGWEDYRRTSKRILDDEIYLNSSESARVLGISRTNFNINIRPQLTEYALDKSRQIYFKQSDVATHLKPKIKDKATYNRLQDAWTAKDMTSKQVAAAADCAVATLYKLNKREGRGVAWGTVKRICAVLELSLEEFGALVID